MSFDVEKLSTFPLDTGVYLMKKKGGTVLYVGKANNLQRRVKQYFVPGRDGRHMVPFLISQVDSIDTIVVSSEKEALLLENTLIKKYKPKYNALLKDDKTYVAIKINNHHPWPMLQIARYKGNPKQDGLYFGPYPSAWSARQTLDLLQRMFPMRQCSDQEFAKRKRPCILYDMKRCSAPCVGLIKADEYQKFVDSSVKFLRGRAKDVLKDLYKSMEEASDAMEYELAASTLRTIRAIENTIEGQAVDKPIKGLNGDVLGIFRQGDEVIIAQMLFQSGKLCGAKIHNFSEIAEDDSELLTSFLIQQYQNQDPLPEEIITPIELENSEVLEEIISPTKKVHLFYPRRGEKKELTDLARKNAETAFKQSKDEKSIREKVLLEMQEKLRLSRYPRRIECLDNSNLSGGVSVAALVAHSEGEKDKSRYRKYNLKQTDRSDDYGGFREVLFRRYKKAEEEQDLPDLIIIDGGKGHLNVAMKVLQDLNIASVDVISIAKEEGRHDKGVTLEQVYLPNIKDPLILHRHSSLLFFLQRIRDEAHRFAITHQKSRRIRKTIRSALSDIPGIGPVKQKKLLLHFGSVKRIKEASKEELSKVLGLSHSDIEAVILYFSKN